MDHTPTMQEKIKTAIDYIIQIRSSHPFLTVAIDGRCGSGKTTLANGLCDYFSCPVVHMDDFYLSFHRQTLHSCSTFAGHMDLDRIQNEVILPRNQNKSFTYSIFDCRSQTFTKTISVDALPLLIIEGTYSHHPQLGNYAGAKLFSDIPPPEQQQRIFQREGTDGLHRFNQLWIPREEAYFFTYKIRENSHLVL
ncbi:MAG TPA: uridine kinase [Clostridiales bacterium]|jgi:uridine kinase|nr:uridine kinase [Clostridiales bacterium]HCG36624.1 uridine kinase [Clostridiales bacterium]